MVVQQPGQKTLNRRNAKQTPFIKAIEKYSLNTLLYDVSLSWLSYRLSGKQLFRKISIIISVTHAHFAVCHHYDYLVFCDLHMTYLYCESGKGLQYSIRIIIKTHGSESRGQGRSS